MYPSANSIRTGTLFFCTKDTIVADTTKWVLDSKWSHIAVAIVIDGDVYIAEALPGGNLGLIPYEKWILDEERQVATVDVDIITRKEAMSYLGTPYDKVSVWNLYLKKVLGKWYGHKEAKGKDKLYCIEYVAILLGMKYWYCAVFEDIIAHLDLLGYDTSQLK